MSLAGNFYTPLYTYIYIYIYICIGKYSDIHTSTLNLLNLLYKKWECYKSALSNIIANAVFLSHLNIFAMCLHTHTVNVAKLFPRAAYDAAARFINHLLAGEKLNF